MKKTTTNKRPIWLVPGILYAATWLTTTLVGYFFYSDGSVYSALAFSAPLMTILTCHELGHYLQNKRYGVDGTLPYFIPLPLPPLGTFGAVIKIRRRPPNLRALFDVGISGPLAGLILTLFFLVIGLECSTLVPKETLADSGEMLILGEPLIVRWTAQALLGYDPKVHELMMHPTCLAAWVGVLLTTLNLFPVGQLDGGHVFYALTRRWAKPCSYLFFGCAAAAIAIFQYWNGILFLVILFCIGLKHAVVVDDSEPIGWRRAILGWATLAFIVVGFTPEPIVAG